MGDLARLIEAVEAGTLDPQDEWDWLRDPFPMSPAEVAKGDYESDEVANIRGAYRGSLDAAKALHDALLPDYGYGLGGWGARVWLYSDLPHWDGLKRQEVELPHAPARAWLLAILRALEAEGRG